MRISLPNPWEVWLVRAAPRSILPNQSCVFAVMFVARAANLSLIRRYVLLSLSQLWYMEETHNQSVAVQAHLIKTACMAKQR